MTDITEDHRARVQGLIDLSKAASDILQHGIGRFNQVMAVTDPECPMAATLMWEANVIDAHQAEYQEKLAQLRAIVEMFPEAIE